MKLWKATVEIEVLIASEEEPDDYTIASEAAAEFQENCGGHQVSYPAEEVLSLADVPERWLKSIPRGDANDMTCNEIVEQVIKDREQAAWNAPMPNQISLPLEE